MSVLPYFLSENSCIFSVGFAVVPRLERSWGSINHCGFAEIWVCVFVVFRAQQQPQIILLKEGTDTSEGKPWLTGMHVLQ
jgi:hypothetical protein